MRYRTLANDTDTGRGIYYPTAPWFKGKVVGELVEMAVRVVGCGFP